MDLKIISAGAGSGKTYNLTQQMARLLMPGKDGKPAVRASGILATTFTNKAAAELKERVRIKLLEEGLSKEADELGAAMIGTVHSIGVQLLKRFAFEAGVSPDVDIIADDEQQTLFNQSLATILTDERTHQMEALSECLGFRKNPAFPQDWRKDLRSITDIARANNFELEVLEKSKDYSINSFLELLPDVSKKSAEAFKERLAYLLEQTIIDVDNSEDSTKARITLLRKLKGFNKELRLRGHLYWHEWLGIAKACDKAPKRCRDLVSDLREFALSHDTHPQFYEDLRTYISLTFELAIEALKEYESYKNSRGLIDYTDMEVMILKLLDNELVMEVLHDELDLLLVDEFQDTNPIQLKIFLRLTKIAKKSIWVGDPKQSIYGFRGAAPELMKAVMDSTDDIEVLGHSWRSRQDLVNMCNGLFTEAFNDMPEERVALEVAPPFTKQKEAPELGTAIQQWLIKYTEGKRIPGRPWLEKAMAKATAEFLKEESYVRIKGTNEVRRLKPSDVAILCYSNRACQDIAEQLHLQGVKASISRSGLLETPEACLLHACLKFILNEQDSLSIAEIMLLMEDEPIHQIIEKRLAYLEKEQQNKAKNRYWGAQHERIKLLNQLRRQVQEMSATEILNLLIEKLEIRRKVAAWGNIQQRFDNIDALRSLALQYEENCNRLHNAATLGGFLLWLDDLAKNDKDEQGAGADENAVNVLTYHKSKGLEWPVVICYQLGRTLREDVFSVRVVSETDEVDLDDPLAGRLLCFWVNPYADLRKNTALMDAIDSHPDRKKIKQAALDEEARLLYVGFTRARDYLILPVVPQHRGGKQNINWLNRVFHHGEEDIPAVDPLGTTCMWTWKGEELRLRNWALEFPKSIEHEVAEPDAEVVYLKAYSGEKTHDAEQPESPDELFANLQVQALAPVNYHAPIELPEELELEVPALTQCFRLFIRSDRPHYSLSVREKAANHLIQQYNLESWMDSVNMMNLSKRFYRKMEAVFGKMDIETAVLFKYKKGTQFFKGKLDYLLKKEDGTRILIMDSKTTFEEYLKRRQRKHNEFGAYLFAAQKALELQAGTALLDFEHWVHFPLEGNLMPLQLVYEPQMTR